MILRSLKADDAPRTVTSTPIEREAELPNAVVLPPTAVPKGRRGATTLLGGVATIQ